jgi:fumarylacetoacetase
VSGFSVENLPYGAFERDGQTHLGVAYEEAIVDLHTIASAGAFDGVCERAVLQAPVLNAFLAQPPRVWHAVRERLRELVAQGVEGAHRVERAKATTRLPFDVADYVDFYSSEQHARNLGRIFRPDAEPLLPNWKWMPIGYHGRAGTIVVDGTPVARPLGQRKPANAPVPAFGPSTMLDFELELGFVTGGEEIFGLVLVNDWSARDVQAWEYQPLGPFLGKSFATTISPWVVPLEALAPFRVRPVPQDPPPLPHLRIENDFSLDVELEVRLRSAKMRDAGIAPAVISRTNARELYWTMAQQLAHARSNGTKIRPGDLFASGTISGSQPGSYGSMIELTWRGTEPLTLPDGEQRAFLEDGDEVTIHGWCERGGLRLDLGSCSGTIVPPAA